MGGGRGEEEEGEGQRDRRIGLRDGDKRGRVEERGGSFVKRRG